MELITPKGRFTFSIIDPDGHIVGQTTARNVITASGLTTMAQALMWSGVEDQAANLGLTTPYLLVPLYGAVGSGPSGTPSNAGGTATLGTALTYNTTYTGITLTSPVSLAAGSTLTLGFNSGTTQTLTVPSAVNNATSVSTDHFTANASYAATTTTVGIVQPTDTQLGAELSRSTVSGGGALAASSTQPAEIVWTFFFGTTAVAWTVTEAAVFAQASSATNDGTMMNHALLSPLTKPANYGATLQLTLSFGVPT